jgi:hypothetical protein
MSRSGYEERFLFDSEDAAERGRQSIQKRWRDKRTKLGRLVTAIEDDTPEHTPTFTRQGVWVTVEFVVHDSLEYPESEDAPSLAKVVEALRRAAEDFGARDPRVVEEEARRRKLAAEEARIAGDAERRALTVAAAEASGERAWILDGAGASMARLWQREEPQPIHGLFAIEGEPRVFEGYVLGDTLHVTSQPGGAPRWGAGTLVVLRERRRTPGLLQRLFSAWR